MIPKPIYTILLSLSLSLAVSTSPLNTENISHRSTNLTLPTVIFFEKRNTNVIVLNICPNPMHSFGRSWCNRSYGIRTYQMICHTDWGVSYPMQYCPPTHLCVDGVRTVSDFHNGELVDTAYCVSPGNFVKLSQRAVGSTNTQSEITASYHDPGSGRVGAVEAILTDLDGIHGKPVNASSFSIEAQASDTLGGVSSWRSTLGGTGNCENCSSVGIKSIPTTARRIDVKVVLQMGVTNALLYLANVSS